LGRGLFSNSVGCFGLGSSLDGRLGAAGQDLGDADGREQLAVTVAATRIVAATLLEDDDGLLLLGLDQLGSNQGAFHQRSADGVANHEDFVKGDDVASLGVEL